MPEIDVVLIPARAPVGACVKLDQGMTLVGRSPVCGVLLADPSVSRRHAELHVHNGLVTVRDLNSQNGTYVEEMRITSSEVLAGQVVQFGNVRFVVEMNASNGTRE